VCAAATLIGAGLAVAAPATPAQKPVFSAERAHAAGSVRNDNPRESANDVVKVAYDSDGQNLLVTTTVKDPVVDARDGGELLELNVDADDKTATGAKEL
jgi:hypothetical protein